MRVFITGATGFIGANLTRRLIKEKYETHILLRKTSNPWRITDILSSVKSHHIDITELTDLKKTIAKIKPEVIFHLANNGLYAGKSSRYENQVAVNIFGTVNLIEALKLVDYRCLVITGSSAEYGPKKATMKEKDTTLPTTIYGVTKLTSTLYAQMTAKTSLKPIIVLRLFSPFGPYDDKSRLIPYVIANALAAKPIYLASPNSVRDFIFVEDVVDAYLATIMSARKFRGEIINIGSGYQSTVRQVVSTILNITNSKSKIYWGSQIPRPQESPKWQADIKIAKNCLNWKPRHSLEEGLQKTISWLGDNLDSYDY